MMAWLIPLAVLAAFIVLMRLTDRLPKKKQAASSAASNGSVVALKRGFDLHLDGDAEKRIDENVKATTFAVQPPNFRGIAPIPKMLVEVGDTVLAGDPLFHDKINTSIIYVSPVSGEVIAINRGERRAIHEVVILADREQQYRELPMFDVNKSSRESLVSFLCECGGWTLLRQRPYDIVAQVKEVPENIFISTFDTAPLAPDLDLVVQGKAQEFQEGLNVLAKLTSGKVHLGLNAATTPSEVFTKSTGVEKHWFSGKHPAGNVGTQIHHVDPIRPKDQVWTLGVQEVLTLGEIFTKRRFHAERIVAIAGAEVKEPKYVRTYLGANLGDLLKGNLKNEHVRIVSGDVLCGEKKAAANFLNYYDDQITVLEEGDYFETFGWLLPKKKAPTHSGTFAYPLFKKAFRADTNTHGERRAFVMTGEYESVLPMDVYPQHLMKAIIANDFEKMEGLGIHELIEEDVALCEFVCTSKQPLQQILRQGLNTMHEQG